MTQHQWPLLPCLFPWAHETHPPVSPSFQPKLRSRLLPFLDLASRFEESRTSNSGINGEPWWLVVNSGWSWWLIVVNKLKVPSHSKITIGKARADPHWATLTLGVWRAMRSVELARLLSNWTWHMSMPVMSPNCNQIWEFTRLPSYVLPCHFTTK